MGTIRAEHASKYLAELLTCNLKGMFYCLINKKAGEDGRAHLLRNNDQGLLLCVSIPAFEDFTKQIMQQYFSHRGRLL